MLDEIIIPKENEVIQSPSLVDNAINALSVLAGTRTVEVELPLLMTTAFVKPITGSQELRLRTMKATGAAFVESFNKVLYEHTTFSTLKFNSFQDFNSHLTPPDKALLTYAILNSTFKTLPEKIVTCPSCGDVNTIKMSPEDIFHADSITAKWEHKEDFTDYRLSNELIDGLTIYYKMPVESDRIKLLKLKTNSEMRNELDKNDDILSDLELYTLYIDKIVIDIPDQDVIVLNDFEKEIYQTIINMPLDIQAKIIEDISIKEFTQFIPKFYLNIHCENLSCEKPEYKWKGIDPEQDFFLKALSVYN